MPLYDFHCRSCGNEFEGLVRTQDLPVACPSCKSADLEKLSSGFAVRSKEKTAAAAPGAVRALFVGFAHFVRFVSSLQKKGPPRVSAGGPKSSDES
jgi:putative FmdB family regulatory protein